MPSIAPAITPALGEYMRAARRKVSQIASSPASAEGSRAANSLQPSSFMQAAIAQYVSGGFSIHGLPEKVGTNRLPPAAISRAHSA